MTGPKVPERLKVPLGVGAVLLLIAAGAGFLGGFSLDAVRVGTVAFPDSSSADAVTDSLHRQLRRVQAAVAARAPRRNYVVIDRANNRLWLRTRDAVKLEAIVSTGSGTVLKESGGAQRSWTFDTPPGRFKVLSKRPNPVWTKPDWAFLEQGQQPPATIAERRERGSLGEWALDLGDGYMIHGTLYERLLGRAITHGCIRVGRSDLRVVANAASPGTSVYIF